MKKAIALLLVIIQTVLTGCHHKIVVNGDNVYVRYSINKLDGTRIDDSNCSCAPAINLQNGVNIKVGNRQVIQGWDEALVGMQLQEEKTVLIPPDKGYGSTQPPVGILPNDTLKLWIKVTKIN